MNTRKYLHLQKRHKCISFLFLKRNIDDKYYFTVFHPQRPKAKMVTHSEYATFYHD